MSVLAQGRFSLRSRLRQLVMGLSSTLILACPLEDLPGPSAAPIAMDAAFGQDASVMPDAGHGPDADFAQDASAGPNPTPMEDAALAQDAGPIVTARGSLLDARDGQRYATVTLGGQVWMAQSLNYGPQQSGVQGHTLPTDDGKVEKYCLADDPEQCRRVGGLYSWPEALALPAACVQKGCAERIARVHRGICPLGWHVPSHEEWSELALYLARRMGLITSDENLAWPVVATVLKSAELWTSAAAGSDETGFGALPTTDWVDDDPQANDGIMKGALFHSTEEQTDVAVTGPSLFEARGGYASFSKQLTTSLRCIEDR